MLTVNEALASSKSRLVTLRIASLTLRLMENWRRPFNDADSIMIILAIIVITAEKLTREKLDPELENLANPLPPGRLSPCNLNSIAVATGLNRETARRKVNKLAADGFVVRNADGSVSLGAGVAQQPEPAAIVRAQLETLRRTMNELLRDDVVNWSRSKN